MISALSKHLTPVKLETEFTNVDKKYVKKKEREWHLPGYYS